MLLGPALSHPYRLFGPRSGASCAQTMVGLGGRKDIASTEKNGAVAIALTEQRAVDWHVLGARRVPSRLGRLVYGRKPLVSGARLPSESAPGSRGARRGPGQGAVTRPPFS